MISKTTHDRTHEIVVDNEGVRFIPTTRLFYEDFTGRRGGLTREDALWLRDALNEQFPQERVCPTCDGVGAEFTNTGEWPCEDCDSRGVLKLISDPNIEPGTLEVQDENGNMIYKIINIG